MRLHLTTIIIVIVQLLVIIFYVTSKLPNKSDVYRLEYRLDARMDQIESRLSSIEQNNVDHLSYHVENASE